MADKLQLLLEGERRGLLNERQKAVLFEAKRRGLVITAEAASPGSLDMTARSQAAIEAATPAPRPPMSATDANLAAFSQGALQGYGDELIGAIEAVKSGFEPGTYTAARDSARRMIEEAEASATPGVKVAGNLTTGIPAALATGGTSLPAVLGVGAAEGGINRYGETAGNDLQAVKDVATGMGLGGLFAFGGSAAGKIVEKFIPKGLAADVINKALGGAPGELIMRMRAAGASAAETDEVLREVLRVQSSKNSQAATAAVPAAESRLTAVNQQAVDDVSRLISPENVAAFTKRTQGETSAAVRPNYAVTETQPAGPIPNEIAGLPGYDEALAAAKALAEFEKRAFDPANLTVKDLDVMQRFLRLSKEKAFQGNALETLKGPAYGTAREAVNDLAKSVSPELAEAQARVAVQKAVDEATELGKQALSPTKEAVEVAEEFAALSPEAQAGYRAAFASRLRAQLAMRGSHANAANVLDKPAVIEKMKAVGFPPDVIDAIIQRGAAARGVLDSLVGGSQAARLQAAQKASESPMTKVTPGSLGAAALTHWSTLGILPLLRSAGRKQEEQAAAIVIDALTAQDPALLQGLMRRKVPPSIGLMSGALGASLGQGPMSGY
jgi:hypothetical protein